MSSEKVTAVPAGYEIPSYDELRELRICAGLTKTEVAERGEWAPSTVSRWEKGAHSPTLQNAQTLLEIYRREGGVDE